MMQDALKRITQGKDLSFEEAYEVANAMMREGLDPLHASALLAGLKVKGETYEEISGFARGLKDHAVTIQPVSRYFYDIVGTGGDGANTFNISTTCAIVLAGAGLRVAKHGNRSISSRCGSADVLEALGVDFALTPEQIGLQLDAIGLTFIFAPLAHPAMRNIMPVRKGLGIPTIFNIIGPLVNPIDLEGQYIGVFDPDLVEPMAQSMVQLGIRNGLAIHGYGGLDELSLEGPNLIAFIKEGEIRHQTLDAVDLGLDRAPNATLTGGDAKENAEIVRAVLEGKPGPHRDVVLLNCAAALFAFGHVQSLADGLHMAAHSLDSGAAAEKLSQLIASSQIKEVS